MKKRKRASDWKKEGQSKVFWSGQCEILRKKTCQRMLEINNISARSPGGLALKLPIHAEQQFSLKGNKLRVWANNLTAFFVRKHKYFFTDGHLTNRVRRFLRRALGVHIKKFTFNLSFIHSNKHLKLRKDKNILHFITRLEHLAEQAAENLSIRQGDAWHPISRSQFSGCREIVLDRSINALQFQLLQGGVHIRTQIVRRRRSYSTTVILSTFSDKALGIIKAINEEY